MSTHTGDRLRYWLRYLRCWLRYWRCWTWLSSCSAVRWAAVLLDTVETHPRSHASPALLSMTPDDAGWARGTSAMAPVTQSHAE